MFFALTEQQLVQQDRLRALLDERMPEDRLRMLMDDPAGDDPLLWSEVAQLAASYQPEDLAAALEVLGERLYIGPYLSSIVQASLVLSRAGDDVEVAELHAGRLRATPATADDSGLTTPEGVAISAAGRVSGRRSFVLDGMTADRYLVLGNRDGTACFVEVQAGSPGVTREPLLGLDQTRKLAGIELRDAPGRVIALADVPELLEQLRMVTHAAVAAEQLGVAAGAMKAGLDFARARSQFGRVIGSYQAVKHTFADLALLIEQARAAAYAAVISIGPAPATAPQAVALARITCTEASLAASEWCMQVQGGQGFRWDNVAHLYLKRAKSSQLLFGDPGIERQRLARLLDLG